MTGSEKSVIVSGLGKSFGDVQAVRGISFEVGRGEVAALLGPNGAGKTTTVDMCRRSPSGSRLPPPSPGHDVASRSGGGRPVDHADRTTSGSR